jgi:hypothetical protein
VGSFEIAGAAVSSLTALLSGAASGAAEAAGNQIYAQISRRLKQEPTGEALFARFERDPSPSNQAQLRALLAQKFEIDPEFRQKLSSLLPADHSVTASNVSVSGSGNVAAGRDYTATTSTQNRRTSFGGIIVAVVALGAIALILILGRAVVNFAGNTLGGTLGSHLSASSTCKDFLLSTDAQEKMQVMKSLYVERNKPKRAADPFILQNADAMCGSQQRQTVTLAQIADVAREYN